jgi:hypothetical protein
MVLYSIEQMKGIYIILQQATFENWVRAHYGGATLGTFITCIKCIFLHNVFYLILVFTFSVWA